MSDAEKKVALARSHLERVLSSWDPVDWADLTIYGLYAVETAVQGAAEKLGISWEPNHPSLVKVAGILHETHDLPDVSSLLIDLQRSRIHQAYGDIQPSGQYSAEEIATEVEEFVVAVEELING